jgi:hypothetical protein
VDGRQHFNAWQPGSACDRLTDSIEPSTLPASLPPAFQLMVPVMCRKLELTAREERTLEGIPVTRYTAATDSLRQDACYCPDTQRTPCLPSGYLNLEPCYPDISPPLAVSFPHGLHSPPNRLLTTAPRPDPAKHELFMDINRELGVPLAVRVSFQLSAVLRPDPAFPFLDRLNSTRLVPLFWASEGFPGPTPWMASTTRLALALPALGARATAGSLLLLGILIAFTTIGLARRRDRNGQGGKS